MISRQWKCILKAEAHDDYVNFLNNVVFKNARKLPGFVHADILKRETDQGLEFLVITLWDNLQSIEAFAGENIEKAMVPEEAQQMMVSFDKVVSHYEIL